MNGEASVGSKRDRKKAAAGLGDGLERLLGALGQANPSKRSRGSTSNGVVIKAENGPSHFAVADAADFRNRDEPKVALRGKDLNVVAAVALASASVDMKQAVEEKKLVPSQSAKWATSHLQNAVDRTRTELVQQGEDPKAPQFEQKLVEAADAAAKELQEADAGKLRQIMGDRAHQECGVNPQSKRKWHFLAAYEGEFKANPPLRESPAY